MKWSSSTMEGGNPFTLRVGQLMTGIGAGCGVGLGVGYPIALGSIPVLGDVMRPLTSAGSQAFGGVGYRAFGLLKKLGIKNLKAGVGCGVGIGHGFGAGLALKPGVMQRLTRNVQEKLTGLSSQLQKKLPTTDAESQSVSKTSNVPEESIVANNSEEVAPSMRTGLVQSVPFQPSDTSQAVDSTTKETEEDLRQENQILRTLLRHQELIEDLKEENAALRHLLNDQIALHTVGSQEDLPSRLSAGRKYREEPLSPSAQGPTNYSCRNCFDCRRHSRRRRRM